jgi:hypothetical protein
MRPSAACYWMPLQCTRAFGVNTAGKRMSYERFRWRLYDIFWRAFSLMATLVGLV